VAVRTIFLALILSLTAAAPAAAESVLFMDENGDVSRVNDPHLPAADLPTPPAPKSSSARLARKRVTAAQTSGPSFKGGIQGLYSGGHIDINSYNRAKRAYDNAKRSYKKVTGARKVELRAVMKNADTISKSGQLSPQRMTVLALTLERNREWWTTGSLLKSGQRIEFEGSELVWQYYPGQGIQLQMLGNFGKLNGLTTRERFAEQLKQLADELIPLASDRGGALAWEYYFEFGGGKPPWTSGLSQATALQALARTSDRLQDPVYRDIATRGLALFEMAPPNGVRVDGYAGAGPHYLIYTYAPDLRVINAFLQSIIGLYDFSQLTGDPRAQALFTAGEAEARAEVPTYNTGSWSLYSLQRESDLSYHKLVRDFLSRLCDRLGAPVYCDTATAFTNQLTIAPNARPLTRRIRGGEPAKLEFELDKISRVGLVVTDSAGKTVFSTSALVGHGKRTFAWSAPPKKAGLYTLAVRPTDLAGNQGPRTTVPLRVLKPRKRSGNPDPPDSDEETPLPPPAKKG
jgi:hypothetical protein